MSKRISQYAELVTLDGSEETVLAVRGKNYRVKLRSLGALFPPPTKEDIGLGLVDNTPDAQKPISTETAQALLGKADKRHDHSKADIEDLVADLAAITNALSSLSTTVGSLDTTVGTFSTSIDNIVAAQNLINVRVLEQSADISNLQSQMTAIEGSNATLLGQFAALANDMQVVNLSIGSLSSQVAALTDFIPAFRFQRVTALPNEFAPNTVYFVTGPDSLTFETFISDAEGTSVRSGGKVRLKVGNVQNRTVVDSVSTRIFGSMKWLVQIDGIGVNAGKRAVMEVLGVHNGNALVDATDYDFAVYAILKTDTFYDLDVAVVLVGAGQNQRMELLVESPSMAVDVHITREDAITL